MVSFESPEDAVSWCVEAQSSLLKAEWPAGLLALPDAKKEIINDGTLIWNGPRVRMGIHTGIAECELDATTGRKDYYGYVANTHRQKMCL